MNQTVRRINNSVLRLAVPSILANITVPLVGMVDLGVAGRLGDAVAIGAMAISTMLFDLLYWNMGFLRIGTGGMVAQAYGRRDLREAPKILTQGLTTALVFAFLILLFQYLYAELALKLIPCSDRCAQLTREYFYIRIWAAPATLSLFVFKGFFIGMQNTVSPMLADILVNVLNLVLSILFAIHLDMGFRGIAYAVTLAQYSGLVLCLVLMAVYYRKLFKYIELLAALKMKELKRFFAVNYNLFIRSLCFLGIYAGFTSFSTAYGDEILAVNTIMMKLLLLYSFILDGFAYAGEALAGKYIGAQDKKLLHISIRMTFRWGLIVAVLSTVAYVFGSGYLVRVLTDNKQVIASSAQFYHWLWIMPAISVVAFVWDGIFVGATSTSHIRNCMLLAVSGFFIAYFALENLLGVEALYVAFMLHLAIRSVVMWLGAPRHVYAKVP